MKINVYTDVMTHSFIKNIIVLQDKPYHYIQRQQLYTMYVSDGKFVEGSNSDSMNQQDLYSLTP